jgi:5'(3')-deoxyribonucleotidase
VRILLDVDGVLADFPAAALRWLNGRAVGPGTLTIDQIHEHDILKAFQLEHLQDDFDQWCIDTEVCRHLPVYDGAQALVEGLRTIGEVVILTSPYAAVPHWQHARLAWLEEHFGIAKEDVVFAKRKEFVGGDMLLDDKLRNIEAWSAAWPWGAAVVFDRPWNQGGEHERVPDHGAALRYAAFIDSVLKKNREISLAVRRA